MRLSNAPLTAQGREFKTLSRSDGLLNVQVMVFSSIALIATLGPKFQALVMIERVALKFTLFRVRSFLTIVSSLMSLEMKSLNERSSVESCVVEGSVEEEREKGKKEEEGLVGEGGHQG